MKTLKLKEWQFVLMMSVCVLVWALAFPFIKIGLEEFSFVNLTIMRFFIVCIVFSLLILIFPKKFSKLNKKDIIQIFLLGFFGVIVYHLCLNYGEQLVSPGAASLIIATIPIYIIIFAKIFLKEKIGVIKLVGVIIALFGVLIISIWGKEETIIEIQFIFAAFAIFIAAIMGAIYTIAGKKFLDKYSPLSLTAYAMIFGSIGLIPLISKSLFIEVTNLSFNGWFAIIFLGSFSTVIGYAIWYIALQMKNASEISVYLYVIPIVATIVSYFWFKENITILFILGALLVILGLVLVNKRSTKN